MPIITLNDPTVTVTPVNTRLGQAYQINVNYGALAAADFVSLDVDTTAMGSLRAHCGKIGLASAGEVLELLSFSDVGRTLSYPGAAGAFTAVNPGQPYNSTSANTMNTGGWWTAPFGRLRYTNGATPQTTLRLNLVLLPF